MMSNFQTLDIIGSKIAQYKASKIKKMLRLNERARAKTKNSNLQPKILPGYVRGERVKCGKKGCKCERGELHGLYFYHYTWSNGRRTKSYVKLADVKKVQQACQEHRDFQRSIRLSRANWRELSGRAREWARFLSDARKAKLI